MEPGKKMVKNVNSEPQIEDIEDKKTIPPDQIGNFDKKSKSPLAAYYNQK